MKRQRARATRDRVTLHDVAALAGCSTATISRALNNPDAVGAALRARIASAVEHLGYLPNSAARALRSRRSRIIGAVIPTINYAIYARMIEAIEQRLAKDGYSLLLTTCDYDPAKELQQSRLLLARGAEGIILIGDSHEEELYRLLDRYKAPYVNTYVFNPDSGHPCVGFDNRALAAQATEYLHALGHRRIGVVVGKTENNDRQSERVAGVRVALEKRGLTLVNELVIERPHVIEGGCEAVRILRSLPDPPTAILCGSDVLAFGAVFECEERSVRVPQEFSIIGFDDQDFARHLRPPLTTIAVPGRQMGWEAAEYILRRLYNEAASDCTRLEAQLIVRETTAPPAIQFLQEAL